jgi:hypothetical protein
MPFEYPGLGLDTGLHGMDFTGPRSSFIAANPFEPLFRMARANLVLENARNHDQR